MIVVDNDDSSSLFPVVAVDDMTELLLRMLAVKATPWYSKPRAVAGTALGGEKG